MKTRSAIDLTQAEISFGLANAPLFLTRRLQSDPAVQQLSRELSGSKILSALRRLVGRKPKSIRIAAKAYAYLVALWFNQDPQYLEKSSKLDAPHLDWFEYIARVLLQTKSPSSTATIHVPAQLFASPTTFKSNDVSNNRITIKP
jgi:hypothetical protein